MNTSEKKKQKIDIVLTLYGDLLYDLTETIKLSGIDYDTVRRVAYKVLDESLANEELSAILKLEGSLNGKFPGVQNRIKNLLRGQVKERLLNPEN